MDFKKSIGGMFMVSNEGLVFEIQQARAAGDTDKENLLVKELLKKNAGLIHEITIGFKNVYAKTKEDKEDIEGEAKVAFSDAIMTFDSSKGAFLTWMHDKIQFAMLDWVRNNGRIWIPVKLQGLLREYNSIVDKYMSENEGKVPSDNYILIELNKKVKVNEERFNDIKAAKNAQNFMSMNEAIDEKGTTIEDIADRVDLCVEVTSVEDTVIDRDEQLRVRELIKQLPEIEFKVLYGRFYEDKTLSELAEELGYKRKQDIDKLWNKAKEHLMKMQGIQDIGRDRGWLSEN